MNLPTITYGRVIDGIPCITLTEHVALMREYRNAALEEAAKVCDELFADVPPYSAPDCPAAIRNLKEVQS